MADATKGFITILTGIYSFQDCVHFLAAIRKFHSEPVIILIDRVPKFLYPFLTAFKNVILKPVPNSDTNPVLASRLAKLALYEESIFDFTIYLDADICLLTDIQDVFTDLSTYDLLLTEDVQPKITAATNLIRDNQQDMLTSVLSVLQSTGLPLQENSIQYNGGFMAFCKTNKNQIFFDKFKYYFENVRQHQDKLLLKDQGALAAAIATVQPTLKVLPPTYNYLSKWKDCYSLEDTVKVLHCTYPYRPQYAKNITRSLYTKIVDKLVEVYFPNQITNPWRKK
jgi:lipopolysaccharide biosynthesis glycosyltransferase